MTGWNLPPGCTQADIDRAFGSDEECLHEEYEVDYEGRAHCDRCNEHWWPSEDEINVMRDMERSYDEYCRREERRQRWQRLTLLFRWPVYRILNKLWPRRACDVLHDDEIPF